MAAPMKMFSSRPLPVRSIYLCQRCLSKKDVFTRPYCVLKHGNSERSTSPQLRSKCSFVQLQHGHGQVLCRTTGHSYVFNPCAQEWTRNYSNGSGPDVKGAVFYVQNPLSWLKSKWILLNLHQKYDSTFTVDEFLSGAKQALCLVTELLSKQQFEKLQGLVHQEVTEWLEQRVVSFTEEEREALNLQDDNIALVKVRGMKLDEKSDMARLYIDIVCFAMKRNERSEIPYIVDLGFRFCRDYVEEKGASDWIICAVTHLHIKELGVK